MTKYVGCAVVSAVAGCGEVNVLSEYSSNTADLQQHNVFRAGYDVQK